MDWSDVGKKIIAVGAPLLGGALGGPAGAAIGQVVASQFGITDKDPAKVFKAIEADPEAHLKLTELEFRHSERLIELENEHFKLQTVDVQQARSTHQHHWMPSAITLLLSIIYGSAFAAIMFWVIPDNNKDMINFMLGQLSGMLSSCVIYWVGSTRASANKDELLRK